jgi:DNA-binding response OmpR family regulator
MPMFSPAASPVPPAILIVEDNEEMRYLLEFMLAREGFSVRCVPDGRAALSLVGTEPVPDAVLLDVMLPFTSGHELIRHIRADHSWKDVPIIMLTARSGEEDVVRAFDAGASDYIVKPFQIAELLARVRRFRRAAS